ncbi:ATP-binding protein [Candidatus Nomurabacteria bacterium]|nr:ATP-binding protein [Candidatus Nomurabacteria bacterium]
MITRKCEKVIEEHFKSENNKALLITGARQVGKTFTVREFGKQNFEYFVEINCLENTSARELLSNVTDTKDLLLRLSVVADKPLVPGNTLIFIDEIQECKEIVTAVKFLVEEASFKYILSGSLLGVDLKDIRSVPVGYMDILEMYPLDFEEFLLANMVSVNIIDSLRESFVGYRPVDEFIHEKMTDFYRLYLITGGMPAVVMKYLTSNNIKEVIAEQRSIITLYKKDIAKYDPDNKLYLEEIFDLIPSELNSKNKRFILKDLNENLKFSRYSNSFLWLKNAGVALPCFSVTEPKYPLLLTKKGSLFKLFMSDVGLLASMYMNNIQIRILKREKEINFGSVYENAVAQELKAHGFDLYYFNSKKQGEVDFLIEYHGEILPVEIKSGKNHSKHAALNNLLRIKDYGINKAFVFHNGNVSIHDNIYYLPVYFIMFLRSSRNEFAEDMIYKIDTAGLN